MSPPNPPSEDLAPDPFGEEGQAMHDLLLAELSEEDERAIAVQGARVALEAGVDPDLLPELYGVTAEEARGTPRPGV